MSESNKRDEDTKKEKEDDKKELDKTFKKIPFVCGRCSLSEQADYLGTRPPWTKRAVSFPKDTYLLRDPFQPPGVHFLILGGACSIPDCGSHQVCQDCSLVYAGRRFCLECASDHAYFPQFPNEIQTKIMSKLDKK